MKKSWKPNNTLPETNSSPLKIGLPNRTVVFQPSIFRGYVSFRECTAIEQRLDLCLGFLFLFSSGPQFHFLKIFSFLFLFLGAILKDVLGTQHFK